MEDDGTTVDIKLTIKGADDKRRIISDYAFSSLSSSKGEPAPEDDGTLHLDIEDWVRIRLYVEDELGRFQFPKSRREAIWIAKGDCCPNSHDPSMKQIKARKVSPYSLELWNWNNEQGKFSYTLRFKDSRSGRIYVLDPIIHNGGGGPPSPTIEPVALAFVAAIGAIAAVLFAVIGFRRGRDL